MVVWFEQLFPRLVTTGYQITSPETDVYNCVAWAAGDASQWWWPVGDPSKVFWPTGVTRKETIDAFRELFETLGYQPCVNEDVEVAFEKIALFANMQDLPTHVSRQLPHGLWTSKLGQGEDIEHDLRALEGDVYGTVVLIMKRTTA